MHWFWKKTTKWCSQYSLWKHNYCNWNCVIDYFVARQATFQRATPDSLQVSLSGALRTKVDSNGANVMVALHESGLVTDCPMGENKGRILSNDFVVRKLEKLCTVKDISAKKTISGTVNFPLWPSFNPTKCSIAVFVQSGSHQIFGSQNIDLPNNIWDIRRCTERFHFRSFCMYRMWSF